MARRGRHSRPIKTPVFIATEGPSDRAVLRWITDQLPGSYAFSITPCTGGSPAVIIRDAIKRLRAERAKVRIRHAFVFLDSDCWDDNEAQCRNALREAEAVGLELVFFNPKLEALLLRLHPGHHDRDVSAEVVDRELKRVWGNYDKGLAASDLAKRFDAAVLNALSELDAAIKAFMARFR